jgi:hypothetical protein
VCLCDLCRAKVLTKASGVVIFAIILAEDVVTYRLEDN